MTDEEIKAEFAQGGHVYCFQCDRFYESIKSHDVPEYLKQIESQESRINIQRRLSKHFCVYSFESYSEAITN